MAASTSSHSVALPLQDFFFFEHYNTLEELVVTGIFPTSDLTFNVGFRLPQTIKHLAFADGDVHGLKYCARELLRLGLPRLRQVSIGVCTSDFPDRDWPNQFVYLARVCDDRGVPLTLHGWGLSLSTDYWNNLTQSIHREYPVPVDRFPRDWTIENLYRMNTADEAGVGSI